MVIVHTHDWKGYVDLIKYLEKKHFSTRLSCVVINSHMFILGTTVYYGNYGHRLSSSAKRNFCHINVYNGVLQLLKTQNTIS